MDLFLAGRKLRLSDADLIGEGGEARVFKSNGLAVKVFHEVAAADVAQTRARVIKLEKLKRFPTGLPANVLAPVELARNSRDEVVGFSMQAVTGADDAARLSQRRYRDARVSNDAVSTLFRTLAQTLEALHARGVTVGDLNDGNVLVRPLDASVFLIDADSMQFDGLPCAVGHERFLDPKLYGVDLSSAPKFDAGTDWYAFAVMLFSSWLYVHPYGGTHATLPTLLRRAEGRHSVMRDDVAVPRVAASWKTLSDDAADYFQQLFERDRRLPPPASVLETRWSSCTCGVTHARAVCPVCKTLGPLATKPLVRTKGRCIAKQIFETPGRVLDAAVQGRVVYAYEADGVVRREDGTVVVPRPLHAREQLSIGGNATWLLDERGGLSRFEAGHLVERAQTGLKGPLACDVGVAYRAENEWLVEQFSGARVGKILEGQTQVWTGAQLGLGLYRAGGLAVSFVLRTGRAGLKQCSLPMTGRLVAADAVFDAEHALLSVTLEQQGRDVVHRWLFSASGEVLGRSVGGRPGHAALLGGRVVIGADDGLVALKLDGGHLLEGALFPDTQPFLSAQDRLLAQSDGSLVVVTSREVLQLSLL